MLRLNLILAILTLITSSLSLPSRAQIQSSETIFEDIQLSQSGPESVIIRGISGGDIAMRTVTEQDSTQTGTCAGFIDREPDHVVVLRDFFDFLSLEVASPDDTTLLIRGPGGLWCNDDYAGRNPAISGAWLAGQYEVWVGSYRKDRYHPYLIQLSSNPDTPTLMEKVRPRGQNFP
jgi:hypothetical protein